MPYEDGYNGSYYGITLEEYITNSTLVQEEQDVIKYIQLFLWKNNEVQEEVKNLLQRIVQCDKLSRLIQVVSLVSWRIGVLHIRPNYIFFDTDHPHADSMLDHYSQRAIPLFLYLHEKPYNSFLHASIGACSEKENWVYFHERKANWKREYESYKQKKVDENLDIHNNYLDLYRKTKDEKFRYLAKAVLENLRLL